MDLTRSAEASQTPSRGGAQQASKLPALPDLDFMPKERSIVLGQVQATLLGRCEGIITYAKTDARDFGWCGSDTRFDAYTALVDLAGCPRREQWYDERQMWVEGYGPNTVNLFDRSYKWRTVFTEPVEWVLFHVPHRSLREYAFQNGYASIELPSVEDGFCHQDTTLAHIANALLPVLADVEQPNSRFVDHVFHAAIDHLVQNYCTVSRKTRTDPGLLAPWQLRRVKEYISANLSRRITIADLAGICGLSPNHFGCTFKRTMDCSPHQWILEQRVDRAKCLLRATNDTLSEIAAALGFADQSHFTTIFSKRVKVSPAAWRRANVA